MTYKFVIHPVDLQDHDGFLSFLSHYAGQGYQAVQIHRSFTLFRRTDTPPAQYSMAFCPRTDRLADGLQPIPGLHNGILIVPQAGSPEARETWNQTVVADYAAFVPYNLISLLSKIIRFLVLPVVVLSVFLSFVKPILQDTASLPIPQAVLYPLLLFIKNYMLYKYALYAGIFCCSGGFFHFSVNSLKIFSPGDQFRQVQSYSL